MPSGNKALLQNNTASERVKRLFTVGYNAVVLAERLETNATTVRAICNGSTRSSNDLYKIHTRLIDVFCKTKWE